MARLVVDDYIVYVNNKVKYRMFSINVQGPTGYHHFDYEKPRILFTVIIHNGPQARFILIT